MFNAYSSKLFKRENEPKKIEISKFYFLKYDSENQIKRLPSRN